MPPVASFAFFVPCLSGKNTTSLCSGNFCDAAVAESGSSHLPSYVTSTHVQQYQSSKARQYRVLFDAVRSKRLGLGHWEELEKRIPCSFMYDSATKGTLLRVYLS